LPHQNEDIEAIVAERDELRARVEELSAELSVLRDREAEHWLSAVQSEYAESTIIVSLRNSVSWRVTKPLRAVQSVRLKVKRVGLARAVRMSGGYLKNRLATRRRG
jgi:hypothetical protein